VRARLGNWTAYWPNELVCDACATCASPRANQAIGHSFIRLDDGRYARCDDAADASWLALSATSRRFGAACAYAPPCFDWTGARPYSEPLLDVGSGVVSRAAPAGRAHAAAALALNVDSGERDTLLLFGGYSADCTDYCNDTWHYSLPNNLWVKARAHKPYTSRCRARARALIWAHFARFFMCDHFPVLCVCVPRSRRWARRRRGARSTPWRSTTTPFIWRAPAPPPVRVLCTM
jgi:hypothetical protein